MLTNALENKSPNNLMLHLGKKKTMPLTKNSKNHEMDLRVDYFGNVITHGGKQKISFIDNISKTKFEEIINIANYKEYNKNDEQAHIQKNGCCLIY